jgi:hypothetical protein
MMGREKGRRQVGAYSQFNRKPSYVVQQLWRSMLGTISLTTFWLHFHSNLLLGVWHCYQGRLREEKEETGDVRKFTGYPIKE